MTPSYVRWRTWRDLEGARLMFGADHPFTHAALARARLAWGGARIQVPVTIRVTVAYRRAILRAGGAPGWGNRRARRRFT